MIVKKELLFLILLFLIGVLGVVIVINSASASSVKNVYAPPCGHEIPLENINKDIQAINKCPTCDAKFPYLEPSRGESGGNYYQQSKNYQGPKVFGRGYHRDIEYKNKYGYSVKSSWKVSPDGNSGAMSSTTVRTYNHTVDGEYGTLVGPGAYYGYGY